MNDMYCILYYSIQGIFIEIRELYDKLFLERKHLRLFESSPLIIFLNVSIRFTKIAYEIKLK